MTDDVALPVALDPFSLAEYIEVSLLINPVEHLSPSELRGYFPYGQGPASTEISLAMGLIERRAVLAQNVYPYRISDGGVIRVDSTFAPVYDLMSLISMESTPMRLAGDYTEADPLFDAVVREATAKLLGPEGCSLIFWLAAPGWTSRRV